MRTGRRETAGVRGRLPFYQKITWILRGKDVEKRKIYVIMTQKQRQDCEKIGYCPLVKTQSRMHADCVFGKFKGNTA